MRRTLLLSVGLLLAGIALGSDSPKEYDDATETQDIEGTWRRIALQFDGKAYPLDDEWVYTFHKGHWIASSNGVPKVTGTYKIDVTRTPAHLDLTTPKRVESLIYRINGDTLRIGEHLLDPLRPDHFAEPGIVIQTYKRVK